jgi:hypothetical protein
MTRPPNRQARRRPGRGIGAAVVLVAGCAACCAGPLLAALSAVTAASAVTALFVPAMAVLALAAAVGVAVLIRRRRDRRACASRERRIDLPDPVLRDGAKG